VHLKIVPWLKCALVSTMSLRQCLRVCVLLVTVDILCVACRHSKLKPGDVVKKKGDNGKEYVVQTCLGMGVQGEVWTLNGSDRLLKARVAHKNVNRECLFGKIAAQKDSTHFTNCFDHGEGEVWKVEGSELKLEKQIAYTLWERAKGQQISTLMSPPSRAKELNKVFPDLHSVFDRLNELFHMFDTLQQPGTIAPGIGVRQWTQDWQWAHMFASADGFTLIDYGMQTQCCNGSQECAVNSVNYFEPCTSNLLRASSLSASKYLTQFMVDLAFGQSFSQFGQSDWFKRLHNTSLESLVRDLRSGSGPSREMFRDQWDLQSAKVIVEMAKWRRVHEVDAQWPPLFMNSIKVALESVPLSTPITQELLDVDRKKSLSPPIHV